MEYQEFKFIYDDYKQQIKDIPPLQLLLRLTEKSTKKLECINLYSIVDKREFDLQLEEQQIMQAIADIHANIREAQHNPSQEIFDQVNSKFEKIKQKNIETFDVLNRQDELLTEEIQLADYWIDDQNNNDEIREEDQFEDYQGIKDSKSLSNDHEGGGIAERVNSLKKQIDEIMKKISKINHGRGKWFQSDHNDFVKVYNKCSGNDRKIIQQGIKVLGMKNTEIMDHLEIYQNYLQLQKQKKLISEEYKQIKLYSKLQEQETKANKDKQKQVQKKLMRQKNIQENQRKKQKIREFQQKKNQEKMMMLKEKEKEKQEEKKKIKVAVPNSKKRQIVERNKKFIESKQNNFKKTQQKIELQAKIAAQVSRGQYSKNKSRKNMSSSNKIIEKKKQE